MLTHDKYRLQVVFDHVYLLQFEEQYDLNMHFLRLQEFYESTNPLFRGRHFKILDYMRWYSLERDGAKGYFSYHDDWAGFNVPSHVFDEVYRKSTPPDINDYDVTMTEIYETLLRREGDDKFYVIGSVDLGQVFDHEVAHALYYTSEEYKSEQLRNITMLPDAAVTGLRETLIKEGYIPQVIEDEIQAYLSTGIGGSIQTRLFDLGYETERKLKRFRKKFIDTYKKHNLAANFKTTSLNDTKLRRRRKKNENQTDQ